MNRALSVIASPVVFVAGIVTGLFDSTDYNKPDAKRSWHKRNPNGLPA